MKTVIVIALTMAVLGTLFGSSLLVGVAAILLVGSLCLWAES